MTDHLEQAAAKAIELATELPRFNAQGLAETAMHLTYLAGLIRGGAVAGRPGMCGELGMGLLGQEAPFCTLRAGHAGWHEDNDGCSWGEVTDAGAADEIPLHTLPPPVRQAVSAVLHVGLRHTDPKVREAREQLYNAVTFGQLTDPTLEEA